MHFSLFIPSPFFVPLPILMLPLRSPNFLFSCFVSDSPVSLIRVACRIMVKSYLQEHGQLISGYTTEENLGSVFIDIFSNLDF